MHLPILGGVEMMTKFFPKVHNPYFVHTRKIPNRLENFKIDWKSISKVIENFRLGGGGQDAQRV